MKTEKEKSKIDLLILGIAAALLLAGCQAKKPPALPETEAQNPAATYESLSISSNPSGAKAKLSSGETCVTPCKVRKSLDSQFTVTVEKEGYAAAKVEVMNNLEALKKFNRARGAKVENLKVNSLRLTPNPVAVSLEPQWSK